MLDAEGRDDRLGDPRSPQGVSGISLGRAASDLVAEYTVERRILRSIVRGCPGAVQVDIVDFVRIDPRSHERVFHGELNACSIGMGRRHVISVGALAIAEKRY